MTVLTSIRLALAAAFLASLPAHAADASMCYAIGDADVRAHCIAKARKDPSMCWAIKQPDLRSACLAEVRR